MDRPRLFIVGGGFAGLWATAAARVRGGDDIDVTLITSSADMTIRPRLYESDLAATLVPLEPIVMGLGAGLRIGTVTAVDPTAGTVTVTVDDEPTAGDAIVLAAGSTSPMPAIPGLAEFGHRIDTIEHAARFRSELTQNRPNGSLRVTVVGGGLTGIELATERRTRDVRPGVVLDMGRHR